MIALSSVKKSVYVAVASVASIATLIGVLPTTANAETYKAPITNVKDGVAANDSARVPAVESTIGRGSITVGKEGAVTLPGIGDAAAVLVRISVFSAKSDADITVSGSPALHAAAGQDVSATVLSKVKDGKINVGSSAAVDARIEVLATFASDAKVPGSTVALDAPVTRADTAKKIGADSLGTSPIQLGVVGLGGVPSSDVRAVYTTATIDATQSGTVTFAGQQFTVNAGRTVVSTIVTPDENGNIAISADKNLGSLRVDVRGYVAGAAQNQQYANVQGGYVPVTGTDWQSADATQGTDASVKLPNVDGSLFALALVNAEANGKRSFVDVGKSINGRSSGVLVDKSAGAAAQLEVVEQAGVTSPVSVRGGKVKTNVLLLGDVLGEKPSIRGTVNVSIDSPSENADIDFAKTAGVTLEGKVSADSAVRSVDIYGNGIKIGTAAVRYTADGGSWRFDGAAPNSGFVSYEAKAIARDGATATAKRTVKVTIPDANATIIDPKVKVIDAATSPVTAVDDKGLTLNRAPDFTVGNIIVSDVSAGAPQGFLRWVDSIQQDGGTWRVTTHQATFTDTFVQAQTSQGDASETPDRVKMLEPDTAPNGDITVIDGPEKSVEPTGDSAKVTAKTSSDAQTAAYTDVNSSMSVAGVDMQTQPLATSTDIASTFSTKSSEASKPKYEWVDKDKDGRDIKISTTKSYSKELGKPSETSTSVSGDIPGGGSVEVGDDKVTIKKGDTTIDFSEASPDDSKKIAKHIKAEGGATAEIKVSAELYVIFGLKVVSGWSWNPVRHVSYFKSEGGSSLKGELTLEASGSVTFGDPIPLDKFEQGKTFLVGVIPVYVSSQTDVTFEPSIKVSGKVTWSKEFGVESQVGAKHEGIKDNLDLKPYANTRPTEDDDDTDTTCPDTGISAEVTVEPKIGIGINPKLMVYDAAGPGIKVTPSIGGSVSVKLESTGKWTRTFSIYAELSGNVTFDLQVPIIDKNLKHWESTSLSAKIKLVDEKSDVISVCKPSDKPDKPGAGGGSGGGGGSSWDSASPVTVNWTDPKSGKSHKDTVKSGTQFKVTQADLETKLGLKKGALDGMKGVSTEKDGKGTITRIGNVYQANSDVTLYVFYTDTTIPSVDANDTDIVFVIDSTGSMSDEIDSVKENVKQLADSIKSVAKNYRIALVDYKDAPDQGDPYQSRVDVDFTDDVDTFKNGISDLYADGGGDTPESVYSGINTALDLKWRDGVRKSLFVIGDAPGKDPEPVTGFTQKDIVAKAKAEGVDVYPMGRVDYYDDSGDFSLFSMPFSDESNGQANNQNGQNDQPNDQSASPSVATTTPLVRAIRDVVPADDTTDEPTVDTSSFEGFTKGLAEATGGTYTEYTSEDFVDKLLNIVVSATVAPDVSIAPTQSFHTGDTVHLNVTTNATADDPIVSYEWNFGQGTPLGEYDQSTTVPEATTVFSKAGTYTVTVAARTKAGATGRGTLTVVVTDRVPTTTFSGTVTKQQGKAALFTLPLLPGTEAYGALTFDNGSTTKVVPGEGTWQIERVNDLILASFTPEAGYKGFAPTPQTYLLSDTFGTTVNGRLTAKYL